MAAKEKFDSIWDEKKDAESVANKCRRFWISTSVQPRDSAPGWVVYINADHVMWKAPGKKFAERHNKSFPVPGVSLSFSDMDAYTFRLIP